MNLFLPSFTVHCVAPPPGTVAGRTPAGGAGPDIPGHEAAPLQHLTGKAPRAKAKPIHPIQTCPASPRVPASLLPGTSLQPLLPLTSRHPGAPGPGTSWPGSHQEEGFQRPPSPVGKTITPLHQVRTGTPKRVLNHSKCQAHKS